MPERGKEKGGVHVNEETIEVLGLSSDRAHSRKITDLVTLSSEWKTRELRHYDNFARSARTDEAPCRRLTVATAEASGPCERA